MQGRSGRLRCAALLCWLLIYAAASEAQPRVRNVLVLQSFNRGNPTIDNFSSDFFADLDARSPGPVNIIQFVIGPTGFVGPPEDAVVNYIRATFAGASKPDLIVTIAGPAAAFARKHRQQIFPDTPVLFASVDERYLRGAPLGRLETAVAVRNDYPRIVKDILQLLPGTSRILLVTGTSQLASFWRRQFEIDFRQFRGRVSFLYSDDLSLSDLIRRCANLPRDSAILYLNFGTDARGGAYADERVLADLHATSNAPVFGGQSPLLGHGVVGGTMVAMRELSRTTADVAARLLSGESPESIRLPTRVAGPPIFDWRELRRWKIDESRLPAGSVVYYRDPGLWEAHRDTVVSVVGILMIQSLLIAGLLYERRARKVAEIDSRRNFALAADASRRSTISALASSIAHELGQSLSSMMHNAHALQMLVVANRADPEAITEILDDIRGQGVVATQIIERHRTMLRSRQLDKKPIDLHSVIRESVALLAHDMSERQVSVSVDLSSSPCVILGDPVLLQQVLVNLLINAMDAMAATPPGSRRLEIRTEVGAVDVRLSVRDSGSGLPAQLLDTIFTPFVTTKSRGLGIGLTIVRAIVEAHGGTIVADNNSDGGAIFTMKFDRAHESMDAVHT